MSISSDI